MHILFHVKYTRIKYIYNKEDTIYFEYRDAMLSFVFKKTNCVESVFMKLLCSKV